ncbi:hypothetical protein [Luteolibacter sp. Populi]|uniref:hypothetical protein n=1 Tax=Luteolibacter sp. Populi TaxID=3230487 RepID=UPI0034668FF5
MVVLIGVAGWSQRHREPVEAAPEKVAVLERPMAIGQAPAPDFSHAPVPAIPAGHEGHGVECAACEAERGLAVCREDYAQMEFARLSDGLQADEVQSRLLLESCRQFAAAVVKDWSHAKSRPELPADAVVAAQRQQILEPVLIKIPRKPGGD